MTRVFYVLLAFITLLALGLRSYRLDAQSIWLDEASSWHCAQAAWPDLADKIIDSGECNPPLYFALLKLWIAVKGDSGAAMRSLSVLFGTLTVSLLGWFVGRLAGAGPGCLAALLLAAAPFHIEFSQEARCYALFPFLILAATAALSWALDHGRCAPWEMAGKFSGSPLLPFSLYGFLAFLAWYTSNSYALQPLLVLT